MAELQAELQRASNTTLDAQGAANSWAGTTGLDLVGALNTKAGIARADWLDLQGVLNRLAGTTGLGSNAAAALIGLGNGLALPGTAGNYASSPDSVLNSVTGDLDIRVCVKLTDWTPALLTNLIGKRNVDNTLPAYALRLNASGTLDLTSWSSASAFTSRTSSVATGFADGTINWLRATLDVDDGAGQNVAKFYTSADGVTWTQLGSTQTVAGTQHIEDTAAALVIGSTNSAPMAGTIYYAEVRNGIDGQVVAKFDTSVVVSSGTRLPATVNTVFRNNGDQANTTTPWTINGTGWAWESASPLTAASMALSLPGTSGNYASTPDTAGNSVVSDIDLRVKVTLNDWTPAASQTLISKEAGAPNRAYRFMVLSGGQPYLMLSQDGTTASTEAVGSAATGLADGATKWLRATWVNATDVVQFFTSDDGVAWTQLGTNQSIAITGIADTTAPVEIGSRQGGSDLLTGKVHYAEVRNGIDGPIVARFDPSAVARTGVRLPTTLTQPGGTPNLLTPNQASIETDATGWAVNLNCTIARSTVQFLDGAASLAVTAVALGASAAATTPTTTAPVVPGKSYTATLSMRAAVTARTCRVIVEWYTAASGFISASNGAGAADSAAAWTSYTVSAVAPATAAFARVLCSVNDAAQLAAEIHYVDRVSVVESAAVWTISGTAWDWVAAT